MKTITFSQNLTEISKIIRKDIKDFNKNNTQFVGSFAENCEVNALPKSFLQLMSSILEGDCTKVTRGVLTASQIAMFNFRSIPTVSNETSVNRHIYKNPLVTYIGLLLHNRYRCKNMINDLNNIGLCVSYKTVLQISTSLGNAAIARYNSKEIVCPSRLKFGVVTTVAIDNIGQSTSSMTATTSFHGTAISITQHPLASDDDVEQEPLQIKESSNTKLDSLPQH